MMQGLQLLSWMTHARQEAGEAGLCLFDGRSLLLVVRLAPKEKVWAPLKYYHRGSSERSAFSAFWAPVLDCIETYMCKE